MFTLNVSILVEVKNEANFYIYIKAPFLKQPILSHCIGQIEGGGLTLTGMASIGGQLNFRQKATKSEKSKYLFMSSVMLTVLFLSRPPFLRT